eukprot:10362228-Lingulodinium_polyedra.AAC.1
MDCVSTGKNASVHSSLLSGLRLPGEGHALGREMGAHSAWQHTGPDDACERQAEHSTRHPTHRAAIP